jgi:hypothetical protein
MLSWSAGKDCGSGHLYLLRDDNFGTIERLMKELELVERLDAIVDKCLKRLLIVRGVKSVALTPPPESPQIPKPRDVNRPTA